MIPKLYIHKCTKCGKEVKESKDYKDCAGHYEWVTSYYKCECGNTDEVVFDIK